MVRVSARVRLLDVLSNLRLPLIPTQDSSEFELKGPYPLVGRAQGMPLTSVCWAALGLACQPVPRAGQPWFQPNIEDTNLRLKRIRIGWTHFR
jgi:hypothetical protein